MFKSIKQRYSLYKYKSTKETWFWRNIYSFGVEWGRSEFLLTDFNTTCRSYGPYDEVQQLYDRYGAFEPRFYFILREICREHKHIKFIRILRKRY